MSARWFRFYADAMRNPKVAKLSDKQFRLWVQLLAVASENDGKIPAVDDLKHVLNRRLDHLLTGVKELLSVSLIDQLEVGYEPHNWGKFQYKSDTSKERVAKHRAKRNVTVTPPETETETETDNIDKSMFVNAGESESKTDDEKPELTPDEKPKTTKPKVEPAIVDEAIECYRLAAQRCGWKIPIKIDPTRRAKLVSRLDEHGIEIWKNALRHAMQTDHLGHDPPTWFSFDWITKNSGNILKVLEGNYDKRFGNNGGKQPKIGATRTAINQVEQRIAAEASRQDGLFRIADNDPGRLGFIEG